jgi:hypothetical protein
MKNIFNILSFSLIALQSLAAIDLHTDKSCEQLKTAIQLAQPLEKIQEAWNALAQDNPLPVQDKIHLTNQVVTYAQEQKEALAQELKNLCYMAYKWAAAQAAFGLWCTTSLGRLLHSIKIQRPVRVDPINWALFPITCAFYDQLPTLYNENIAAISFLFGLLINIIGPYFFYKAYWNLSQGLDYKNSIEEKIKNLTAAIEFLQQSINQ